MSLHVGLFRCYTSSALHRFLAHTPQMSAVCCAGFRYALFSTHQNIMPAFLQGMGAGARSRAADLRRRDCGRFQVRLRYLEGNRLEDASLVSHVLQVVEPPHNAPEPPKLCWREVCLQDKSALLGPVNGLNMRHDTHWMSGTV